jgi:hypothetical protein
MPLRRSSGVVVSSVERCRACQHAAAARCPTQAMNSCLERGAQVGQARGRAGQPRLCGDDVQGGRRVHKRACSGFCRRPDQLSAACGAERETWAS